MEQNYVTVTLCIAVRKYTLQKLLACHMGSQRWSPCHPAAVTFIYPSKARNTITTKDVVTRRVFKRPNAFGGRAPPWPAGGGSLSAPPDPLAAIGGSYSPTSKEKGRKGEREGEKRGDCLLFIQLLATCVRRGLEPSLASGRGASCAIAERLVLHL